MGQDIKKMLAQESELTTHKLSYGHRNRFENKLNEEFPNRNNKFSFLRIAASFLVLISIGLLSYQYLGTNENSLFVKSVKDKKINSISDISPDLKKVEDYYLSKINYQISKIKVTDKNKDLLEVYFSQLSELQKEYDALNAKLNIDESVNEGTIDQLIENLQMRLLLLKQLKLKLNKIEKLKQNVQSIS